MNNKGNHTWDLHLKYHKCPKCDFIIESRKNWKYLTGRYEKEIDCPRCKNHFIITKPLGPVGPLFGEPPKPEFDWS